MNIVYLIGNGFDLNLKLKTSYKDFYKWYGNQPIADDDVLSFIKFVDKKSLADDRWSDMEYALGQYTVEFKSEDCVEEATTFHDKLIEAVSTFIKAQESLLSVKDDTVTKFSGYLSFPDRDNRLLPAELRKIDEYRSNWSNTNWKVNIISFNYTSVIEKLIQYEGVSKRIGTAYNGKISINLSDIEHIHGYVEDRLVLGVNDETQIANQSLHKTEAMDWYVKSKSNDTCGLEHEHKCKEWINTASLICVFGLSYGDTDKQWWNIILTNMLKRSSIRLILFSYDPSKKFTGNQMPRLKSHKNKIKDKFIEASNVKMTDEQKKELKDRIYVGYNTNMFAFENDNQSTASYNLKKEKTLIGNELMN